MPFVGLCNVLFYKKVLIILKKSWLGVQFPLPNSDLTLVRSIGCVMQAAPADAKPPKYHLDTILVAGLPPAPADPAPDWPTILLNKV